MHKQAKILSEKNIKLVLSHLESTRYPVRNKIIVLLSLHGLRAKEISAVTWSMVIDADGQVDTKLELHNNATKGKCGGRVIFLSTQLRALLIVYKQDILPLALSPIVRSERGCPMTAATIANWFGNLYRQVGLIGASSHSGRRTFITKAAKKIVEAGGSLRDVQILAGHKHLSVTQRYIEQDNAAQRKVVGLVCDY